MVAASGRSARRPPRRNPLASLAVIALFQIALPFQLLILPDERLPTLSYKGDTVLKRVTETRLETRFLAQPEQVVKVLERGEPFNPEDALEAGLVSFAPDELDWDDEVRLAIESRAALSPDALTGMEANLRFAGPETMETKIFGRLTAWQNWIFIRPNAVGEKGALTAYGSQSRPEFDYNRT